MSPRSLFSAPLALLIFLLSIWLPAGAAAQVPTSWEDRYTGLGANGYDEANAIVVDKQGNVYVTGQSGLFPSGPQCCVGDFVTTKYNAAGARQWVARYNGPGNSHDSRIRSWSTRWAMYVAGGSTGNGTGMDIAVLKYNSAGTLLWEVRQRSTTEGEGCPFLLSTEISS